MSEPKRELPVINADTAGIDLGAEYQWVSVPEDRDSMFQILETQGFEVKLVNARHVKTVPGRKSDVLDCQWLRQLHSYGLLAGSFRPDDQICVLRSYIRQRGTLIKSASTHIQRMQKALTQMNVQLHRVISDISGTTGLAIIRAIVAEERDLHKLAALKDLKTAAFMPVPMRLPLRLRATIEQNWSLCCIKSCNGCEVFQAQIAACDLQIESSRTKFADQVDLAAAPLPASKRRGKKQPGKGATSIRYIRKTNYLLLHKGFGCL